MEIQQRLAASNCEIGKDGAKEQAIPESSLIHAKERSIPMAAHVQAYPTQYEYSHMR